MSNFSRTTQRHESILLFTRSMKVSDGSIMIWVKFCWLRNGALVFFKGKQIAMGYLDMLAGPVHPKKWGRLYLINDNVITTHCARSVQNRFAENQFDFQYLSWRPYSSDLNSTENVWDIGEIHIRQHSPHPSFYKI
ncbi:hypothetical protein TNCV_3086581 [Trichonephila clavipes]|nr:hypothetical protein TNCV_3086581 [Trichonephila clavipes]